MTHWELIHEERRDGFDICTYAAPEEDDPSGHFDDGGETAMAIAAGLYDWFMVKVTASRCGTELGADYLGGCCYHAASDFVREEGGGYYTYMVEEAITQARVSLQALTEAA